MENLKIPVGVSDFKKIRENGYYYVDKSGLILELLKTASTEVTLITRPRRFGKTLGMSMLEHFFDIRGDGRALFQGLEISENTQVCDKWMNQYPVLFVTFKDVEGLTFSGAYGQLQGQIADLCKKYVYLTQSDTVDDDDKKIFFRLKAEEASEAQVSRSLSILLRMLKAYYGKPAILLLDEYDVPLAKASSNGYYEKMLEIVKIMMSTALKDNNSLQFAIVTGCLL